MLPSERLSGCGDRHMLEECGGQRSRAKDSGCAARSHCNGDSKARQGRTPGHGVQRSSSGLGLGFSLGRIDLKIILRLQRPEQPTQESVISPFMDQKLSFPENCIPRAPFRHRQEQKATKEERLSSHQRKTCDHTQSLCLPLCTSDTSAESPPVQQGPARCLPQRTLEQIHQVTHKCSILLFLFLFLPLLFLLFFLLFLLFLLFLISSSHLSMRFPSTLVNIFSVSSMC